MRAPALALALLAATPAAADDADLIPGGVLDAAPEAPAAGGGPTVFLEETLALSSFRAGGMGEQNTISHLARLGVRGTWALGDGLSFALDAQATHQAGDDHEPDWRDARLDIKEAYLAWTDGGWFAEAGRMSLKTGVATGFNPTDHFRNFALITTTTEDSTQWREHRMGAVSVRGQRLWDGGALSLAYAPDLSEGEETRLRLERTNADHRAMLTLSQTVAPGVTPQLVAYVEDDRPHLGATVSHGWGDSLILYAEGDIGRRRTLLDEALNQGEDRWLGQSALGGSLSFGANVVAALEYHFNGAGLDDGDWERWGGTATLSSARALARDRQEPLARHTVWSRVAWSEAFGDPDLTLTALAIVDPRDFSAVVQVEAAYALSGSTSVALRAAAWLGGDDGQYGTASRDASVTGQVRWAY